MTYNHIPERPQIQKGSGLVFAEAPVSPKGWLTEPRKAAIAANGDVT